MSRVSEAEGGSTRLVFRNASLLLIAQVVAAPLSVVVNAVAARTLGAATYGLYYQALTFGSFVFIFVEWGQSGALTARIATHRDRAGELLGSGIAFRLGIALLAAVLVPVICLLVGYDAHFVAILALALLAGLFGTIAGACQDALRGFERTDFAAGSYVGWQLLSAAAVVPTLLAGGGVYGLLLAQITCAALGAAFVLWLIPRLRVPRLAVRWSTVKDLVRSGRPFLVFALVLALQPMTDAAMLSWFAPPEALGWYAAARKLIGVLVFPASALIGALYPTLCRLHAENMDGFRATASDALYAVTLVVLPVALGCAFFPELGVAIFGLQDYAPAQDDLRVLSLYLLLVYFSMPIGSCLAASGRQKAWTVVQFGCVIVSVALDPVLIRWFQARTGNGGLGVCVATVFSEMLMVAGGIWLLPKGVLTGVPRVRQLRSLLTSIRGR